MTDDALDRLRTALAGQYSVEGVIGAGGMATVYRATDEKHGRTVAIKVLKQELAENVGSDRFLREIKVAARLQHPNILGLYDSGAVDGLVYYVMPFVEGASLRERLDREKQLPIDEAIAIVVEVAGALHYAHQHGVIHRDIKPDNILLLKDSGHAMVMDFGIALAVSSAGGAKLTQAGMSVGTPHYMSPEQAGGADAVDGRADVYSLACVLYELLAGQPPFDGPTITAILARHAMEAVPSLQIVRSTVPDELEDIVLMALAKTPADRFPNAQMFADALAGVELGPAARRTPTRAMMRRTMSHRVPTQAVPMLEEEPGRRWTRWAVLGVAVLLAAVGGAVWWRARAAAPAAVDAASDSRRLAVLYFDDDSDDGSLRALADGLTEELIRDFTGAAGVEVVSRNGVAPFRGTETPADSIARVLGVGTLVSGSVEPAGKDRVKVAIRLLDASGATFQRATVEQSATDPLALRDSLAAQVTALLRARLGAEVKARAQLAQTTDAEAWSLLQRAEQSRKQWEAATAAGDASAGTALAAAEKLYAEAAGRDPKWSAPWTGRSQLAYKQSRLAGTQPAVLKARLLAAMAYADSALARQPDDPDALEARGAARYTGFVLGTWSTETEAGAAFAAARADLEMATKLSPTQAGAWAMLSHLYYNADGASPTDAMLAAQRAYEADTWLANANDVLERLFNAAYDLGQLSAAQRYCEEGGRRFGTDPRFQSCRLWVMTMPGQTPDLAAAWKILADGNVVVKGKGNEEFQRRRARLAVAGALARAGLADSARAVGRAAAAADGSIDPQGELHLMHAMVLGILADTAGVVSEMKAYFVATPLARRGRPEDLGSWWFTAYAGVPAFRALFSAN